MEEVPTSQQPWTQIQWQESLFIPEFATYSPSWEGWEEVDHEQLNALKAQIDALEEDGTWELRKKLANPYELVHTYDEKKLPICLAIPKPLSRSYFKMIEMLHVTRFFQRFHKTPYLRSAHVCEGPGGFIQAFIEAAGNARKKVDISLAMTLKPHQAQIPGWKRASSFLKRNPQVVITYGADETGDIYNLENQEFYVKQLGPKKAQLFTADGGFDFKMDYKRQEQIAFRLIVASFAIAFESLAIQGVCIIKLFDTFGRTTKEFLAYVSGFFKEWTLYKPAMSRPCNSERYFIGVGFRGLMPETKDFFTNLQKDLSNHNISDLESLFKTHPYEKLLGTLTNLQSELETKQVATLSNAIHAKLEEAHNYWKKSYQCSELWCTTFNVPMRKVAVNQSEALHRNHRLFDRQSPRPHAERTDSLPSDQASLTSLSSSAHRSHY
jgi:23S rRNA U2552 (ribose-2'-O)-methylase RlmE/FtsJ